MLELQVDEESLRRTLETLDPSTVLAAADRALEKLGNEVKIASIPYPPEAAWNQPGAYPHRWYQRHFGPRWARVDGSIGGRDTSERMQKQWLVERRRPLEVAVVNKASYACWVVGDEQASFHAERGWRKTSDIAREKLDMYQSLLEQELRR